MKRYYRVISLVLVLCFMLSIAGYAEAVGENPNCLIGPGQYGHETYVLIHGAWHGAWCWDKVVSILRMNGHKVIAIDLPGHGQDQSPISEQNLQTYVNKVIQVIDQEPGKVILVGHSMSGIVISQVAEYRPHKVKKLIYLAALLVQDGQTGKSVLPADWLPASAIILSADKKSVMVKLDWARETFYNGCSEEDIKFALEHLCPEATAPVYAPVHVTQKNWGSIPRVYIKTLQDKAVTANVQDQMITASPCEQIYTLNTGHSPFFVAPEELAAVLLKARFSKDKDIENMDEEIKCSINSFREYREFCVNGFTYNKGFGNRQKSAA